MGAYMDIRRPGQLMVHLDVLYGRLLCHILQRSEAVHGTLSGLPTIIYEFVRNRRAKPVE